MVIHAVYGVFCFLIGCCMGSFLGLCAVRLQREESLWSPRSHCDHCGHRLEARELVPLAGYFLNDGRCRYCGALIPSRYFWQEIITGLLFLLVGFQTGPGLLLLVRWGILSLLLLLSFLDMAELQLYEGLFYPLGLLFLAYRFLAGSSLSLGIMGALVLGGGMELLRRWKPHGLGAGDPKLVGLLGFWLGTLRGGESLLWAVAGAFLFVLWRVFQAPRAGRMQAWHAPIPFGPFLCGAAFLLDCQRWGLPFGLDPAGGLPLLLGTLEYSFGRGAETVKVRFQRLLRRLKPWPSAMLSVVLGEKKLVLLQGERRGSQWEAQRYLEMVWPDRLRASLEHGQADPVAQWLQAVCAKRGFTARQVNLSLAPEWTELRELSLSGLSWKEQQEEASWEILQQVSYPAGSFSLVLQPHPDQPGQVLAELLLDRRRKFLDQLAGTLAWKILRVEPLAQSWSRLFPKGALTLLLLRQETETSYGWYKKGILLATGLFPPEEIPEVETLPEQVYLGGGTSEELAAWKAVLEQEWGCPVQPVETAPWFRWAPCYEERERRPWTDSLYGALGGLLPDAGEPGFHFSLQAGPDWQRKDWLPLLAKGTSALLCCLLVIGAGLQFYWSGRKKYQEKRLQEAAGWEILWQEARARQKVKKQQQERLQQLEQKQLSWTSFLTLLGNTLPADCQVTRLQQEKGKEHPGFSLEGRSLSRQAVLQFTKRLQKQPGISGIRLERLEEQPEENPSVQFALHGWWKAGDHES